MNLESAISKRDVLEKAELRIKELEQQNAELAADNEAMYLALEELAVLGNGDKPGNSLGNAIAIKALERTPKQSLANIQADAIINAKNKCMIKREFKDGSFNYDIHVNDIDDYANKLIEEAK